MNTELKNAVKATDSKAQYDTSAKRLLGQKSILAHILVKTVDEFKGMNPKDVVDCIEGTPHISTVPVEPGLTNAASEKNGERLVGFNTENEEINEGLVRFDIVFYVRMKDGLSQIIINVEEKKGFERRGMDIYTTIQIPYTTAVFGGEARVSTLYGDVVCKIKEGTQSGSKIRLRGKGMVSMKDANVHGDHYATIEIAVPRSLNRTARQKLMEYKEAC